MAIHALGTGVQTNSTSATSQSGAALDGQSADGFLSLLTQASVASNSTENAASSASASTSASGTLLQQLTQLLHSGVSIDQLTTTIAGQLLQIAGGTHASSSSVQVKAVANYLRQGEHDGQDPATTAKDLLKKIKTLLSALQQPSSPMVPLVNATALLSAAQNTPTTTVPTPNSSTGSDAFSTALAALQAQSASAAATHSSNAPAASTAATVAPAPPSGAAASAPESATSQPQTLGQASLGASSESPSTPASSGLHVSTDLGSIAAGQGTALERALLRAANVDVARTAASLSNQLETSLASLSASLEEAFASSSSVASVGGAVSPISAVAAPESADTSLAQSALGLVGSASQNTGQTSFAASVASAQSPMNVDDVMDQVVTGLSIKNFTDNPTVKISLNPPHLGALSVKITVNDNTVSANVVTQSGAVRSLLLDQQNQLSTVFAQAGLKLGSLTVDLSGQGLGQEADRRQAQRQEVLAANAGLGISATPEQALSEPTSGPSLLGSVNMQLLNQLV